MPDVTELEQHLREAEREHYDAVEAEAKAQLAWSDAARVTAQASLHVVATYRALAEAEEGS